MNALLLYLAISCGDFSNTRNLELIDNSSANSEVIDLNSNKETIGRKEVVQPEIGLLTEPFFRREKHEETIPSLEGYTNLEPQALSDTGLVVGYAGRTAADSRGRTEAFAWDQRGRKMLGLGRLEGDTSSYAFDVSADGSVVVGYSIGANPPRLMPCVWEKVNGVWRCSALPTLYRYNPFLVTSRVVVSDNGGKAAACITVEIVPGAIKRYVSHLFTWERDGASTWIRRRLDDKALRLANINNHGMVAGTVTVDGHRRAFVYGPDDGFQLLGLLAGDVSAEALDINNHGVVVGYSDDTREPYGGPQAFLWRSGQKMSALVFPQRFESSLAASINDSGQIAGYVEPTPEDGKPIKTVAFVLDHQE